MPREARPLADDLADARLLTVAEFAALMQVDKKTVGHWIRDGWIPDTPDGYPGAIQLPSGHWRVREVVARGLIDGTLTPRRGHGG